MTDLTTLHCVGVRFRVGSLWILDDVSVSLKAGEICGIVGPNGSGKSTFLNVISGFVKPPGIAEPELPPKMLSSKPIHTSYLAL